MATDNGDPVQTTTATVQININDINEFTPRFTRSLYNVSGLALNDTLPGNCNYNTSYRLSTARVCVCACVRVCVCVCVLMSSCCCFLQQKALLTLLYSTITGIGWGSKCQPGHVLPNGWGPLGAHITINEVQHDVLAGHWSCL